MTFAVRDAVTCLSSTEEPQARINNAKTGESNQMKEEKKCRHLFEKMRNCQKTRMKVGARANRDVPMYCDWFISSEDPL